MLGPDSVALAGDITFQAGVIECEKRSRASAALALQWRAADPTGRSDDPETHKPIDLGVLTLDTCLLPDSERPYLLSLELARRRIMLFLVKLEEWGLFDLPASDPIIADFERARAAFTEALVAGHGPDGYTLEQDRLARRALVIAIDAGERLAARRTRTPAAAGEPPPAPPNGCTSYTDHLSDPLRHLVADTFDFINLPMRWSELEPEEGQYRFARADKWIEWAVRQAKIPVTGGPLIDFRPRCVPDWLYIWENDYETLRELIYEHMRRVVTRYRRVVTKWTVASGLHVNANFTLSLEQVVDLTRMCVLLVRKLHPSARIQVDISQPFGEYAAENPQSIPPLLYTELMFQAGIAVDAIGLRIEVGDAQPGRATRDIMQFADLLDRFAQFEKPLAISSLGAPSAPPAESALGENRAFDPGHWRKPWNEEQQARWMTEAIRVAAANPAVTSICWQELCDKASEAEMPSGGLVSDSGRAKLSLRRMGELRRRLRERKPLSDFAPLEPAGRSA